MANVITHRGPVEHNLAEHVTVGESAKALADHTQAAGSIFTFKHNGLALHPNDPTPLSGTIELIEHVEDQVTDPETVEDFDES